MATKASLRKLIRETLNSLEASEIKRQSTDIFEKLVNHDEFKKAKTISLYLSTNSEVDTIRILRHALEVDGKHCFVPYIAKPSATENYRTRMVMVELKSMQQYEKLPVNHYGIKEMVGTIDDENGQKLKVLEPSLDKLDVVIVPGVAFALDGRRLGHGKGYYDEFLLDWIQNSSNKSPMYTIGLALQEQLVEDPLAIDGQDIKLDEILFSAKSSNDTETPNSP